MGGPLLKEDFDEVKASPLHQNIRNFVETGTYKADTTIAAAERFACVFTTEIHAGLYEESKARALQEGKTNITFLLGDSAELLPTIMPQVADGAVFFIDAHISGADSGWNGKTRVPLLNELDVILSFPFGPSVFIFDDIRLWKTEVWDWAHITNDHIVQRFVEKNISVVSFYEKNDRFFVFTS